jgi:hypothetical protein
MGATNSLRICCMLSIRDATVACAAASTAIAAAAADDAALDVALPPCLAAEPALVLPLLSGAATPTIASMRCVACRW